MSCIFEFLSIPKTTLYKKTKQTTLPGQEEGLCANLLPNVLVVYVQEICCLMGEYSNILFKYLQSGIVQSRKLWIMCLCCILDWLLATGLMTSPLHTVSHLVKEMPFWLRKVFETVYLVCSFKSCANICYSISLRNSHPTSGQRGEIC